MNPEYYYVWGAEWDHFEVDLEYSYRSPATTHTDYVVVEQPVAMLLRLKYPGMGVMPYPEYSYYPKHKYEKT